MLSSTAIAKFRQDAFGGGPRRLHRVIEYAGALGRAAFCLSDAMDEVEASIWADGALPIDRPSQRRAWSLTREHALVAFKQSAEAEEAAEAAELRAYRRARSLIDDLSNDATLDEFAAAITAAEPLLAGPRAMRIARNVVTSLTRPPIVQRGPAPGPDPFAETRTPPSEQDFARHRRALCILGVDHG